jgi:hypothetical protein
MQLLSFSYDISIGCFEFAMLVDLVLLLRTDKS